MPSPIKNILVLKAEAMETIEEYWLVPRSHLLVRCLDEDFLGHAAAQMSFSHTEDLFKLEPE